VLWWYVSVFAGRNKIDVGAIMVAISVDALQQIA
jgi:hypothetical protein